MNSDILTGKWNELKGKVKESFGRLTDDDLLQVQGSTDRIVGLLQQRYGYSREQAQQEWQRFIDRHNATLTNMKNSASNMAANAKGQFDATLDSGAQAMRDVADRVEDTTRR
jgi:uncharacterized protein YjbJ (UPF0337 family)